MQSPYNFCRFFFLFGYKKKKNSKKRSGAYVGVDIRCVLLMALNRGRVVLLWWRVWTPNQLVRDSRETQSSRMMSGKNHKFQTHLWVVCAKKKKKKQEWIWNSTNGEWRLKHITAKARAISQYFFEVKFNSVKYQIICLIFFCFNSEAPKCTPSEWNSKAQNKLI